MGYLEGKGGGGGGGGGGGITCFYFYEKKNKNTGPYNQLSCVNGEGPTNMGALYYKEPKSAHMCK